jgi:hypothetical protein
METTKEVLDFFRMIHSPVKEDFENHTCALCSKQSTHYIASHIPYHEEEEMALMFHVAEENLNVPDIECRFFVTWLCCQHKDSLEFDLQQGRVGDIITPPDL